MRAEDARAEDSEAADANEVLAAHHRMLRELTDQIDGAPTDSAGHRELIDRLVLELDIHMQIEDSLYYPAVAKASPLVAVAHAEHREVSDRLAAALRCEATSDAFEVEWQAFATTLHHHAAEEERDMFPQARLIGQRELDEVGAAMAAMQQRLRNSTLTRWRIRVKTMVLRRL
ncbi:hemerythrin domain-containing protein [Dietzia sp. ANT_WB102]|uniref:hemerythrin domain-containing protein n=1 Tax=Dietzia sp. ANT_WB102 TaxID=2597345 RepID=UPI0011EECA38|nr:hemerythrin domain-containing protein [Dietzia sp. ANT_WB102]KAA0917337.1 hemerythrin domain-containing protein [Dietzia sp. ANT_WB102]